MIKMNELYKHLLEAYKKHRQEVAFDAVNAYEIYKWQLITACQNKTPFEIVCTHNSNPSKAEKGGFENLIDAIHDNAVLKYLTNNKPKELESVLNNLINESYPLNDRLLGFKISMAEMLQGTTFKSKANDERTAATILTCFKPQKYTLYKDKLYQKLCDYLGFNTEKPGKKYSHYLELIEPLVQLIKGDSDLHTIITNSPINGLLQSDLLLAQDICWELLEHFPHKLSKYKTMSEKYQKYIDLLKSTHNLILTGAPGTGKTYLAKQIAKAMGAEVGFVQFHPSYDYTDFVEGLRPQKGENSFKRTDGIFKEFCAKALINKSADSTITDKLNPNPIVWKVSLACTGDNPIRKDCMKNGYIRIGWHRYGNIEDFNDFNDYTDGGKNVLRAFQNQMKEGDIIASCYSENTVDAIGIVTGGYEYDQQLGDYPRFRKVDWLVKNINENIIEINNGRKFTLSTVYKSNITAENALKIVKKYNASIKNEIRPFVFIIDEINRGEISKIFGELFFSIDPGYRGEEGKVQTQYQNLIEDGDLFKKGFFVPENVYIIGTMNDIDRSVESMDFAFRRRFAFVEVKAEENVGMLDGLTWKDEAIKRMKRLNEEISKIDGLSSAYHIGASYFLKLKNYNGDFEQLWEYHLDGLLREYLRGTLSVDEKIKKLKQAYDNDSDSNN